MSTRHNRQSFLGPNSEEVIRNGKVFVAGLCGGGGHVAQQLAHIGFGHQVLCDFDTVDETNLNRMVGSCPADAENARPKVDVIEELVLKINPAVKVTKLGGRWQDDPKELHDSIAVVGCVDSFSQRAELEAYARRYMVPYIDVGMDVTEVEGEHYITGQVLVSLPGRPCMHCMGFLTAKALAEEGRRYGDVGGRPQVVWPNGVLASAAVGQLMRLITPWHTGSLNLYLEYDGNQQTLMVSNRTPYFPKVCSHYPPSAVGDPFWGDSN
jgi:molybdopterin-synthase adenylyltransferase